MLAKLTNKAPFKVALFDLVKPFFVNSPFTVRPSLNSVDKCICTCRLIINESCNVGAKNKLNTKKLKRLDLLK